MEQKNLTFKQVCLVLLGVSVASVSLCSLMISCSDNGATSGVTASTPAKAQPGPNDLKSKPLEYQMACVNEVGHETAQPEQIKVARFKYLLDSLAQRHHQEGKVIADYTVKAQGVMREKGVDESLLDTMEAMNSAHIGEVPYPDAVTMYVMVRCDGMSKADASKGLQQFIAGLHTLQDASHRSSKE